MPPTSLQRQMIIETYESLLGTRDDNPLSRRVAQKLGYNLDKNNNNAYVLKVIKDYRSSNS